MRKFAFLFFLMIAPLCAVDIYTEAKVGYFIPTDAKFRHIYAKDGVISGLESSFHAGNHFYPWVSIDYYTKAGHSLSTHSPTHIYFVPIGAGLKYIYPLKYFSVYGGIGALPTYLHIRDHSPGAELVQKNWGCGGVIKGGVIAEHLWNLFVDFFVSYSFLEISNHPQGGTVEMNPAILSHFSIGGGLGYHFGGASKNQEE